MRNAMVIVAMSMLVFVAVGYHIEPGRADTSNRPSPQEIVNMARSVEFDNAAVTDEPVPREIKLLNAGFSIKVYYRAEKDIPEYLPEQGAVLSRVTISGVPAERNLPDGDYYLWIGRDIDSLQAVLVKTDGTVSTEVEVQPKTKAVSEESIEPSQKIRSLAFPLPAPFPLPPGGVHRPPPPRRTWRHIWVPVPKTDHQGGGRWIRVPDN
ncbi:MAG: hypothetical protein JXB42_11905 [Deltaproteobacteria bacterium]|nr:hypothetical protein [Deltaproteobacteria bacterium]